jgi:hypothetical protein
VDDFARLREALSEHEVKGAEDFGYFVSNTTHFRPSSLDERAAMPVLLGLLPTLTDPRAVAVVAGHLRRPWARPTAFAPLLEAFEAWGRRSSSAGWALGDALATSADEGTVDVLVRVAQDRTLGQTRQMVVGSLWRFRKDRRIGAVLEALISDRDVSLHAMSALRRTLGNEAAIPYLSRVVATHSDPVVRNQAASQIKKSRRQMR